MVGAVGAHAVPLLGFGASVSVRRRLGLQILVFLVGMRIEPSPWARGDIIVPARPTRDAMTPRAHIFPMRDRLRPREAALVARLRGPRAVQAWLDGLALNVPNIGRTLWSFRRIAERGAAHCIEGALAAAFVLERSRGRSTVLLDLRSDDRLDHVVLAWRGPRGWGAVGKSNLAGLQGRKAVYRSLRDLAWSYVDPYVDDTGRVKGYATLPLDALDLDPAWGLSSRHLWPIEDALRDVRTIRLRASDARHERQLARYRAWKLHHPRREPPAAFFRDSDTFLGGSPA